MYLSCNQYKNYSEELKNKYEFSDSPNIIFNKYSNYYIDNALVSNIKSQNNDIIDDRINFEQFDYNDIYSKKLSIPGAKKYSTYKDVRDFKYHTKQNQDLEVYLDLYNIKYEPNDSIMEESFIDDIMSDRKRSNYKKNKFSTMLNDVMIRKHNSIKKDLRYNSSKMYYSDEMEDTKDFYKKNYEKQFKKELFTNNISVTNRAKTSLFNQSVKNDELSKKINQGQRAIASKIYNHINKKPKIKRRRSSLANLPQIKLEKSTIKSMQNNIYNRMAMLKSKEIVYHKGFNYQNYTDTTKKYELITKQILVQNKVKQKFKNMLSIAKQKTKDKVRDAIYKHFKVPVVLKGNEENKQYLLDRNIEIIQGKNFSDI